MTRRPRIVGLTGGIGSGKTTAAARFAACGAHVLDADAVSRALLDPGGGCYRAVLEAFGTGILRSDAAIDRKKLAAVVFKDEAQRAKLNAIVHPAVFSELRRAAERILGGNPDALVVLDVPLLFECGMQKNMDATVLVCAEDAIRLDRVVLRDGCTREAARRRMEAQMPQAEKRALADYVLDNNDGVAALYAQVDALYRRFKEAGA